MTILKSGKRRISQKCPILRSFSYWAWSNFIFYSRMVVSICITEVKEPTNMLRSEVTESHLPIDQSHKYPVSPSLQRAACTWPFKIPMVAGITPFSRSTACEFESRCGSWFIGWRANTSWYLLIATTMAYVAKIAMRYINCTCESIKVGCPSTRSTQINGDLQMLKVVIPYWSLTARPLK